MDRSWKLGEDLTEDDAIFGEITFKELILTTHCNVPKDKIDPITIADQLKIIFNCRIADCMDLLKINAAEIIRLAKGETTDV